MAWPKGKPRPEGAGRKKGSQNKTTLAVKEALVEAFEGLGGVDSLIKWGQENPTPFYQLWGKLMPLQTEVSGKDGSDLFAGITVTFKRPDGH
ncbi:hypothetical protein [Ralstonia mannitolilytica]|uniref:hypothetical protein n=1 Tax=Ralstonia mannitolilytica TaxID=105219 RepID=UPI000A4FA75B|nr:hypothetical protein [Ralstonia mannitolilytica]